MLLGLKYGDQLTLLPRKSEGLTASVQYERKAGEDEEGEPDPRNWGHRNDPGLDLDWHDVAH